MAPAQHLSETVLGYPDGWRRHNSPSICGMHATFLELHRWWNTTTNPEFLADRACKRNLRRFTLLIVALQTCIASGQIRSVVALCVLCAVAFPPRKLASDVAIVVAAVVHTLFSNVFGSSFEAATML